MERNIFYSEKESMYFFDREMASNIGDRADEWAAFERSPQCVYQQLGFWQLYSYLPKPTPDFWHQTIYLRFDIINREVDGFHELMNLVLTNPEMKSFPDWIESFDNDPVRILERSEFPQVGPNSNGYTLYFNPTDLVPMERIETVVQQYNPDLELFIVNFSSWQPDEGQGIQFKSVMLSNGERFETAWLDPMRFVLRVDDKNGSYTFTLDPIETTKLFLEIQKDAV